MRLTHHARTFVTVAMALIAMPSLSSAQLPTAEQILNQFRPVHPDVEYDTPDKAEFSKCRVAVERDNGKAGFVVYGPAGEVLRRFTDTNADNKADLFRYYRMGLEVYRDIDSNSNEKPDQHRWMNWGGTRWGIDRNEDGKVDQWRILSAQEAARVAVEAMIQADPELLSTVLVNSEDIRQLQTTPDISKQLLRSVEDHGTKLRDVLSNTRSLTARTKWVRFDPPVPGLIPAEEGRAGNDLTVYENAMAIIENAGKHELVSIGEMVQVGEVWKLTEMPRPLDSDAAQIQLGGILMQPQLTGSSGAVEPAMSKELESLMKQLQALDESAPTDSDDPGKLGQYNHRRAELIEKIIPIMPTEKERREWILQYASSLDAAVQTGEHPDDLKRLTALQEEVASNDELLADVWFRRLRAEYTVRMQPDDNDQRQAAQEWWMEQLEAYVRKWPQSENSADAVAQLGVGLELMGRIDDAKKWYTVLVKEYPRSEAGVRARGALRRLELTGKKLDLAGRSLTGQEISAAAYRGKVLLVVFWASWGAPYTDDLPKLNDAYAKYRQAGFEILGVNLDSNAAAIEPFLRKHGGNWQNIRDAGGMDGQLAREFGIVLVPTMFLVDREGIVAGGITAENLDSAVQSLLKGQKPESSNRQGSAGLPPLRK
ncbi:MAG: redoxin domain-containing protein [Planctomycetaceae bacterium]